MEANLSMKERELVAVGASVAAGGIPCSHYHVRAVRSAGATTGEITRAIDTALCVKDGAKTIMRDVAGPDALERMDAAGPLSLLDEEHDRRTTHRCLLEAARQLPVAARRVLLLCDFGDMPLADAAAALGCSLGAAKVRLHRARRQLATICRAECQCEPAAGGSPSCTPKPAAARIDGPARNRRRRERLLPIR